MIIIIIIITTKAFIARQHWKKIVVLNTRQWARKHGARSELLVLEARRARGSSFRIIGLVNV